MISVVLVNWNGWADTIACIQSLLNSDLTSSRIIVVDNQSSDESISMFERWAHNELVIIPRGDEVEYLALKSAPLPRRVFFIQYNESENHFDGLNNHLPFLENEIIIYVVQSGRNGGFGYGCNVGLRLGHLLGSNSYWLLNNDCVVRPDVLSSVAERIEKEPRIIFGTILKYYYNPGCIQAVGGGYFNKLTGGVKTEKAVEQLKELSFINGASMVISDQCYDEIGGFDEAIFMYFEENDFCIRAAKAGYKFDVVKAEVYHKHGGSQGRVPSVNAWAQVLINKEYVLTKNFGWGPWVIFFYISLLLRSVLPVGEKNARIGARYALRELFWRR